MKKSLIAFMLLLTVMLGSIACTHDTNNVGDNENTENTQGNEEQKPMIPIDPIKVEAGNYVYAPENILIKKFDNKAVDEAIIRTADLKLEKAVKYCKEVTSDPMDYRAFIDDEYKSITEYDLFGKILPLKYKESLLYADGKIRHCYENITLDENGKLASLSFPSDTSEKEGGIKISEEEAINKATLLIKEHTYVADLTSWVIEITLSTLGNYEVKATRTVSGLKTTETVSVWVNTYSGEYKGLRLTDEGVFDGDITITFDKENFEQYMFGRINAALDDIIRYGDEPYFLNEWIKQHGEYTKTFDDESIDDKWINRYENWYISFNTIDHEYVSFTYELCAFEDGTPYLSIKAHFEYFLTERAPDGRIVFQEGDGPDDYNLCIFPDGSEVVNAQKQVASVD